MNKYTSYSTLLLIFLWAGLFSSCKKQDNKLQTSAHNIYPLGINYLGTDWYLRNNEFGVIQGSSFSAVERIAYNFNTKSFDYLKDSIPPIWQHNKWWSIHKKVHQLNENQFLVNEWLHNDAPLINYHQLYLTDYQLKNKILITGRDSSKRLFEIAMLPDKRIILLELNGDNTPNLICINRDNRQEWITEILTSPGDESATRPSGIAVSNNTILVLQNETGGANQSNVVRSYNYSGNLIQSNFMVGYENTHYFGHVLPHQDGFMLIGLKYNKISHHLDLCFLSMDASLNPMKEKSIPFDDIISDWDFVLNKISIKYGDGFEAIQKPTNNNGSIWLPITYYSKKSGSSLKLIKLNQSFEVELVKPILNNIPQDISSVGVRANEDYIYVGGKNYRGVFFYRMDKNGNFK